MLHNAPGSPKSPLPIPGGHINELVRGAMRDVDDKRLMHHLNSRKRQPHASKAPQSPPWGQIRNKGGDDRPKENKTPPRDGKARLTRPSFGSVPDAGPYPRAAGMPRHNGGGGAPRVAYLANGHRAAAEPAASKIQAVLRGSKTRRKLARDGAKPSAHNARPAAGARRPGAHDWWG